MKDVTCVAVQSACTALYRPGLVNTGTTTTYLTGPCPIHCVILHIKHGKSLEQSSTFGHILKCLLTRP